MIGALLSAIPAIFKLFSKDEKETGVKELVKQTVGVISSELGINFKDKNEVMIHLGKNPKDILKLKKLDVLLAKEDNKQLKIISGTMIAEGKSEHFMQWAWRPSIGFSFALYILSLFILPAFGTKPVALSMDMIMVIGAILGVTAWSRGRVKEIKAGKGLK